MFDRNTERRGFPGGLRAQLSIGLVLLVIGTMALVALVGINLTRRQVEQSALDDVTADVRALAGVHRLDRPEESIESFRSDLELSYARFERADRHYEYGDLPGETDARGLVADLESAGGEATAHIRRLGGVPHAVALLSGGSEGPGSNEASWRAVAVRSMEPGRERIVQARRMLLAYLGIDALFILIVGYAFFTYVVVRPIRAIGVATERAARGDLASPIEVLPPNEFGRVGRSFNRMLDELRENRRELRERLQELDEAYRELEQTQESLIRSEKMASVGQLAAGVAHEIGNPLSALSGYVDCLEEMDLDDEQRRDLLERMNNQVERIQTIIRDLLDFSREEADHPVEPVDLADCVDEAVDLLAPQPRSRGIGISVDLPEDVPRVRGNADQIVQVLINLLMNAADAIKRESDTGEIRIRADHSDDRVGLEVSDDGPGILEEDRERIFDPFYTSKEPGEGTGLGLAIAHRIMDRFGGTIEIAGSSSEGTTLRLEFPAAEADARDAGGD